MFLSQVPLHDSKSFILADGKLAKSGQKKVHDFQGALKIIFYPSRFLTSTCLSQNLHSLHNPPQHSVAQYAKACSVSVILFLEKAVRKMHMYI